MMGITRIPGTPLVVATPDTPDTWDSRSFSTGVFRRWKDPVMGSTITCSLLKPSRLVWINSSWS